VLHLETDHLKDQPEFGDDERTFLHPHFDRLIPFTGGHQVGLSLA
jgi:hypothetical protein